MTEFKRPQNELDFAENFAQIKPLMSETEAYYESSRCLFCYDAPCVNACPTGIDIPLFIRQINSKNETGAAKTIYDSNYFGYACGKVCPTEVLCEGACVYTHTDVKPIEIGRLQSFATEKAITAENTLYHPKPANGKKVAVIGAGPAGISCACELRLHGYDIDIFEAKSMPSGLTIHGIAPYKITNEEVLAEMKYLQKQFGFNIHYRQTIDTMEEFDQLEETYDAIFLAVGLASTLPIKIKGENLDHVYGAVKIIEKFRLSQHLVSVPEKVIVLGGGNTAMDAASESARMGATSVILAYRRSKEEMGAYDFEYDLAKSVGVKGLFNVSPIEILGDRKVTGVKFIRTQTKQGRVETIPDSEFVETCDWVIKATGQSKHTDVFSNFSGIELRTDGRIMVSDEFQTTHPNYFAAGDAVSGGEEVVNAAANGKKAAHGIMRYLSGSGKGKV